MEKVLYNPGQVKKADQSNNSDQPKKGCFIATAAYGNEQAPEVLYLKMFRDSVLSRSKMGRALINFYYTVSPFLAHRISRSPYAQGVVRKAVLRPIIGLLHRIHTQNNTETRR